MIATQPMTTDLPARFAALGIAVIEYAVTGADLARMDSAFPRLPQKTAGARASDFTPEAHNWLAGHQGLAELAASLGQTPMRMSRLLAFDKSASANWFVPWHQDRAEDGRDRSCVELEQTIALRIHLDDCDDNNGPLEVIPGSHTNGRLESGAIALLVNAQSPLLCLAARGDIVAMRPLLVHRSQRARLPAARRVLQIEYAPLTM